MRYLSIYRPTSGEEGSMPSPEHMAAMGRLVEEMTRSGHLLSTEPVLPRDTGCLISRSGGQFTVSGVQVNALAEVRSSLESVGMGLVWCDLGCDGEVRLERILRTLTVNRFDATNGRVLGLAELDKLRRLMATLRERLEDEQYQVKPQLMAQLGEVQEQLTAALKSVQP